MKLRNIFLKTLFLSMFLSVSFNQANCMHNGDHRNWATKRAKQVFSFSKNAIISVVEAVQDMQAGLNNIDFYNESDEDNTQIVPFNPMITNPKEIILANQHFLKTPIIIGLLILGITNIKILLYFVQLSDAMHYRGMERILNKWNRTV